MLQPEIRRRGQKEIVGFPGAHSDPDPVLGKHPYPDTRTGTDAGEFRTALAERSQRKLAWEHETGQPCSMRASSIRCRSAMTRSTRFMTSSVAAREAIAASCPIWLTP